MAERAENCFLWRGEDGIGDKCPQVLNRPFIIVRFPNYMHVKLWGFLRFKVDLKDIKDDF